MSRVFVSVMFSLFLCSAGYAESRAKRVLSELDTILHELKHLVSDHSEPLSLFKLSPIQEKFSGLLEKLYPLAALSDNDVNLLYEKVVDSLPTMFTNAQESDYGRFYRAFYACFAFLVQIDSPRTNREFGNDKGAMFFRTRILR